MAKQTNETWDKSQVWDPHKKAKNAQVTARELIANVKFYKRWSSFCILDQVKRLHFEQLQYGTTSQLMGSGDNTIKSGTKRKKICLLFVSPLI